jgi:hypothetical protein
VRDIALSEESSERHGLGAESAFKKVCSVAPSLVLAATVAVVQPSCGTWAPDAMVGLICLYSAFALMLLCLSCATWPLYAGLLDGVFLGALAFRVPHDAQSKLICP